MGFDDLLGLGLTLGIVGILGLLVSLSRLPRAIKTLAYAALALRVIGTLGRYYMVAVLYGGKGDSYMYFDWGRRYSAALWQFDFTPWLDTSNWSGNKWWGTQFVRYLTGVVTSAVGPSFLGGYLVFSLMALLGLVGFGMAFHRAYPDVPAARYLRWIWLFPSLWFWPSAIGKEAVLLMGLGLAMWGFVGRHGRINWLLLGAGVFFVFAVRVQIAAVLLLALVFAHWLSLGGRWTLGKVTQGVLILGIGLGGMYLAMQNLGMGGFDAEGVQGYLEDNAGRGGVGQEGSGSAVGSGSVGLAGIPMALVNILLRPFPWEARNPQLMLTALEIMAFWVIAWFRRRQLWLAIRTWWTDRLLRVAVPFIVVYSITLGMLLANMGLIARQRILLFPFLFLLVEAAPRAARRARATAAAPMPPAVPAGARLPQVSR